MTGEQSRPTAARCDACERRCVVEPGSTGVCGTRGNRSGRVEYLWSGQHSACNLSPIEIKPFYHFWPGTLHLSLGGWGCNFRCAGCQNAEIACVSRPLGLRPVAALDPAQAVELAREVDADGISFTYNEPTVWLEYVLECAALARAAGLLTDMVTNGYMTEGSLLKISGCMDAMRIDVKGTQKSYDRITREVRAEPVRRNAVNARRMGMHLEIVTNLIPGVSDGPEVLKELAGWIAEQLGPETPWHLTRFHPARKLLHFEPTPVEALEQGLQIARNQGLGFAYLGNVPGHRAESTWCPDCGQLLVERSGWGVTEVRLEKGHCTACGYALPLTGRASATRGGPDRPRPVG